MPIKWLWGNYNFENKFKIRENVLRCSVSFHLSKVSNPCFVICCIHTQRHGSLSRFIYQFKKAQKTVNRVADVE